MALLGLPALATAQVPSAPGISETCGQPTAIQEGFLAARNVFFRLRTQPDPSDPKTTWICYRVKVGSTDNAGRIDVTLPSATAGLPTRDANSRACESASGNLVPGPHPLEEGAVDELEFYVDSYASAEAAWVCLEVGAVKERVVVPLPAVGLPQVTVTRDSDPSQPTATMTPEAGLPSSTCYEGDYGPATELVNTDHGQYHVFLFSAQPSASEIHLCARVYHVGSNDAGAHLAVNAAVGQIVQLQQFPDPDPSFCTRNVLTLTTPPVSLRTSPVGQLPQSICLNGTRYTLVTGPVPPLVALDLD